MEKLGEGGMGVVYKARDARLDRIVAIKLLPDSLAADADRRARFLQEARSASALNHPHIVTIHEIGEDAGRHYIVMEWVDGKPLGEAIPPGGMKLGEGLRVATEISSALEAAHAAGIVHRDLKPGNILLGPGGKVKLVDFGLAKLAGARSAADDATMTLDVALTGEGVIVGSAPYMSPEQAEGKPVDARSDIFSFGAVLYEIFSGKRAFGGASRVATMAAVMDRDPAPLTGLPPGLERIITRCLRKDPARRSQHIADVKLELEELQQAPPSPRRNWTIPALAAVLLLAAGTLAWLRLRPAAPAAAVPQEMVRISPDDGFSYFDPAISADGKFVCYLSDRSGKRELWLQQVSGGNPVAIAPSVRFPQDPEFTADGSRLVFTAAAPGTRDRMVAVMPILGGEPRELAAGNIRAARVAPGGTKVAYIEDRGAESRLFVVPLEGGAPVEATGWRQHQPAGGWNALVWTPDERAVLGVLSKKAGVVSTEMKELDIFAVPLDGGPVRPTGILEAFRAAGMGLAFPVFLQGNTGIFQLQAEGRSLSAEIDLEPGAWRPRGAPRRATFGTEHAGIEGVSADGVAVIATYQVSRDLYTVAIDPATGQPAGAGRRMTRDRRDKNLYPAGGEAGKVYLVEQLLAPDVQSYLFAVDITTGKQEPLLKRLSGMADLRISDDGKQWGYRIPDGDGFSLAVAPAGTPMEQAPVVCRDCGSIGRFTPDGRYLLHTPGMKRKGNPTLRQQIGMLEVATGKSSIWLEDPELSVVNNTFQAGGAWVLVITQKPGSPETRRTYFVPWRVPAPPRSEWVEAPIGNEAARGTHPDSDFLYFRKDGAIYGVRFDPKGKRFGAPFAVRFAAGSEAVPKADDPIYARGKTLAFTRNETVGTVWRMKLAD